MSDVRVKSEYVSTTLTDLEPIFMRSFLKAEWFRCLSFYMVENQKTWCRIPIDNAIFQPSKMKLVLESLNLLVGSGTPRGGLQSNKNSTPNSTPPDWGYGFWNFESKSEIFIEKFKLKIANNLSRTICCGQLTGNFDVGSFWFFCCVRIFENT